MQIPFLILITDFFLVQIVQLLWPQLAYLCGVWVGLATLCRQRDLFFRQFASGRTGDWFLFGFGFWLGFSSLLPATQHLFNCIIPQRPFSCIRATAASTRRTLVKHDTSQPPRNTMAQLRINGDQEIVQL